jgi:hypothetical protein
MKSRRRQRGGLFNPFKGPKERSELVQNILTNDVDTVEKYLNQITYTQGEGKVKSLLNTVENPHSGKTPIVFTITKGDGVCVKPFNPDLFKLLRRRGASTHIDYKFKELSSYASNCHVEDEMEKAECEFKNESLSANRRVRCSTAAQAGLNFLRKPEHRAT